MRYCMIFAYDGTHYKGYQKQLEGLTIQNTIEDILYQLNGCKPVTIHASGRTDAHVHAYGQTAHFDLDKNIEAEKLKYSMNQMLPKDIYILNIEKVNKMFHARFDVKTKEYIYRVNVGSYNLFEREYVYQYNQKLDISSIVSALHYLKGTHNFKAFTKVDEKKENYERTIYEASLHLDGTYLEFSFIGNGFLRYMVRNMVGTLIEIGEGKRTPEDIINILDSKDRCQAGKTAPPEGLYLKHVNYK